MKTLFSIIGLLLANYCFAQNIYQIRADTVRIYNTCDTAELVLENRTKDTLGFLYNKGNGRTEFQRLQLQKIGGSQLAITGQDTLDLQLSPDSGSTHYIQNQIAADQPADFRISGIGRSSSQFQVVKDGSDSLSSAFQLFNAAATRGANMQLDENANPGLNFWLHDGTAWKNRMSLTANGKVGIGAMSPLEQVHVADTSTAVYATSSTSSTSPVGASLMIQNTSSLNSVGAFVKYHVKKPGNGNEYAYVGAVAAGFSGPNAIPVPVMVFGRSTSLNSYSESMRINEFGGLFINMLGHPGNPKLGVGGSAVVTGNLSVSSWVSVGIGLNVTGATSTEALSTGTRVIDTDSDFTIDSTDYTVLFETPNAGTTQSLTLPDPGGAWATTGRVLVLIENSSDTWNLNYTVKNPGGAAFTVLPANTVTVLQAINGSWYKIK